MTTGRLQVALKSKRNISSSALHCTRCIQAQGPTRGVAGVEGWRGVGRSAHWGEPPMQSNLLREPAQDFAGGRIADEVCTAPSHEPSTVQRWGVPPKKTSSNGRLGPSLPCKHLNTATRPTSTAFLLPFTSSINTLHTRPLFPCCIATPSPSYYKNGRTHQEQAP